MNRSLRRGLAALTLFAPGLFIVGFALPANAQNGPYGQPYEVQGAACDPSQQCQCEKCRAKREHPHRWTEAWYAQNDTGAIGASQKRHHGKFWPPFPRPQENAEFTTLYHAAHYWPYPYQQWDRNYVRDITNMQVANGWLRATTVYAYHFDPETQLLTTAGQMQVRWILEQAPAPYRVVYIQGGGTENEVATRIDSVRATVAASGMGDQVPVAIRNTQVPGRPALEVDAIRRGEISSQPQPRIAYSSVSGGSSSGGGGGSSSGSGSQP